MFVDPGDLVSEAIVKVKPLLKKALRDPEADPEEISKAIKEALTATLAQADSAFKRAVTQVKDIIPGAPRYTPKEALTVWKPVSALFSALLRLAVQWGIYLNPEQAQRDVKVLEAASNMAAQAIKAHAR